MLGDVPAPDSHDLVRRTQAGDAAALQDLLLQHQAALRAFVRAKMTPLLRAHESAEDLVQSACRELLGKLDDFHWRGEEAFRAWLYTGVLHKLQHRERDLRRDKRDARRAAPDGDAKLAECYSSVLSPTRQLIAAERVRALEAAFDTLPDDYRDVIALSRFARLSRRAIAEQMGRSEDSVKSLLTRALAALATAIDRAERVGYDSSG